PIVYGKSEMIAQEDEICLIAVGSMVRVAVEVRASLKEKGHGCSLINARFVKPVDEEMIRMAFATHKLVVTMEENVASGGFGEKVRRIQNEESVSGKKAPAKLLTITIPDEYVEHGNVDLLKAEIGIDAEHILERIFEII
ncbi:MAG: 1-deoxy-D-xylulose-5-phosphate synthase, partial [Lachnospiraceae bacterium]|nr:1-deoxy-D-xylulose-5-phosphate synthase [Lachnospiraceae bacterium]